MNEDMEKMLQEAPAPTLTLEPFAAENRQLWKKKKQCSRSMKKKK